MQNGNPPYAEIMSHNVKMIGADVHVIKDGGWRGKVEEMVDEEYFMISRFDNPTKGLISLIFWRNRFNSLVCFKLW